MIFAPSTLSSQWDTWLYYEDGVHYLFYLASTTVVGPWDAVGLATSHDGVHFADHGKIVSKAPDAMWLGTGHTWRAGGRYILNFSESRDGRQEILFAESDDLMNWSRIPRSDNVCCLDPAWYADGTEFSDQRWDSIWAIPDSRGEGFFGYVTAVAKDGPIGLRGTAGSVTSRDGAVFSAGPPVIEPGVWGDRIEIGGVEKLEDSYFMLVAQIGVPFGARWGAHTAQSVGGVYVLRSDRQAGPFRLDARQEPLIVSAPSNYTYFARFYPCGEEMLACHHSIVPRQDIANLKTKPGTHLAPLKKVKTSDGLVTLWWWHGNEALKGRLLRATVAVDDCRGVSNVPIVSDGTVTVDAAGGGQVALAEFFDLAGGIVIEFRTRVLPHSDRTASAGLLVGSGGLWSGTAMIADTFGKFAIGPYNGYSFRVDDEKNLGQVAPEEREWRVLIRGPFVEVYIGGQFVQAYTLPGAASGRLAFLVESATVAVSGISGWSIDL